MSLLTITWEIPPGMSTERAAELAQKWVSGHLGSGMRLPRPVHIQVTGAPEPPRSDDGAAIAARRKRLGLSQRQVARKIGATQTAVSQIECGRLSATGDVGRAIQRALDAAEAGR